jgi:hypothetical protein
MVILAAAGSLIVVSGCGQHDQITSYTVRKPELVDPTLAAKPAAAAAAATDNQTLGLIVPVGDMGWFFKLTGDVRAIEQQHEAFLKFIQSIKFSPLPDAKPSWALPGGWKELPGREMRFATIQIAAEGGPPLDLSVIPLPNTSKDTQKYFLDNVNRWRQQLRLPPIGAGDLASSTKTLKVDGHEATLVSLVGKGSGQMSGAPFAPFAGGGSPLPADHPPVGAGKSEASGDLKYTAPAGWSPGKPNAISLLAFKVTDGEKQAEITVSTAGGQWLANVNRWRGQLGLSPADEGQLAKDTKKIETLGTSGDYVRIVGPENAAKRETILGVQAEAGGRTWFVKLRGDSETVEREKSNFESFAKSLRLPEAGG